mgnify:CR=1 FL=1
MSKKKRAQVDYETGSTVNKELDFKVKIKCKSEKQREFLSALGDEKNEIVFGYGSAGVGKTYVALSEALSEVKTGRFEKIIFITPTAEAGSKATNLGLLPGTVSDKVYPYIENLKDTTKKILKFSGNYDYDEMAGSLFKEGKIEVKLMNYARGTTYDNSIVIIDESENFNRGEFLLLLTRMGENTRYFILGCEQQCDRADIRREGDSGMMYALKKLDNLDEIKSVEFTDDDVVRNPLVGKILKAWD